MNRVLNRPMFRQQALRKGHLKPIKAFRGDFMGPRQLAVPVGNPSPGITGVYNPNRVPMVVNQPTYASRFKEFGKSLLKPSLTKNPLLRTVLGPSGYLAYETNEALKNVEGVGPLQRYAAAGLAGAFGFTPPGRIVAGGVLGLRALQLADMGVRAGAESIRDYRATPMKDRPPLPDISGEASMDNIVETGAKGAPETNLVKQQTRKVKPGSGRIGFGGKDRLTQSENQSEVVKGDVDINKVVANNVAPDPNLMAPLVGTKTTIQDNMPPDGKKIVVAQNQEENKPKNNEEANKKVVVDQSANTAAGKVTAADGTPITNETITLAKQYRKELMAGQKSQAGLVFLANLASGLLTGKTTKGGIGGALEVFGAALGPAVNNYATIKLKENELENDFMSDALELARDEIEARNGVLESPEFPDAKSGIIQITGQDGNTRNVTARQLKDGTVQYAVYGSTDQYGRQLFQTAPYGSYDKFLQADFAAKEQAETIKDLSAKYKAYNLGRASIDILKKPEVTGGPKGRLNIFTKRLGDAMNDFGMSFFGQEDGQRKIQEMREDVVQGLMNDGRSRESAEKLVDERFGKGNELYKKTLKQMGVFKDVGADLERLAINETILTYALANSLKSKDRLTEKDIKMAQNLVNVFPMLRGEKSVIQALEAVNETILGDIKRLEFDYTNAFLGDSITIDNYRRKYKIVDPEGQALQGQIPGFFDNMSTEDILGNIEIN